MRSRTDIQLSQLPQPAEDARYGASISQAPRAIQEGTAWAASRFCARSVRQIPHVTYLRCARVARLSIVARRQRGFHEVCGPARDRKDQRADLAPLLPQTLSENGAPRRAAPRRGARE